MKGFIIAGTHSGCGKTTITLGILAALKKKGLNVQSFKAGPDFIDAGLHRLITGRASRNLDLWMCGEEYVKNCFENYSNSADIAIIEGVMGMYDGEFNTARLAQILGLPIILIVDAYGMAESAGAVVKGYISYASECRSSGVEAREKLGITPIFGIIFNRISSERHYERVRNSVHDVPILGYLPRELNFEIPNRHLGLTVAEESPISDENIHRLAGAVSRHVDVDLLVRQCDSSVVASSNLNIQNSKTRTLTTALSSHSTEITIAIAYDKAFCFYYEDNLDLLKKAGAKIVTFSPMSDTKIPDGVDAIYIGGGYPELAAAELAANSSMRNEIREWAEAGKPLYAECGGLMYISKGIHIDSRFKAQDTKLIQNGFYEMSGVFSFETQMKNGRSHLGYREIILKKDCILGKVGDICRGHEFHYSAVIEQQLNHEISLVYSLKNNKAEALCDEGYGFKNTLASYIHIHFGSNPATAENFINFIKETP